MKEYLTEFPFQMERVPHLLKLNYNGFQNLVSSMNILSHFNDWLPSYHFNVTLGTILKLTTFRCCIFPRFLICCV